MTTAERLERHLRLMYQRLWAIRSYDERNRGNCKVQALTTNKNGPAHLVNEDSRYALCGLEPKRAAYWIAPQINAPLCEACASVAHGRAKVA